MKPDHNAICPACGAKGLMEFHTQHQIPTNSCPLLDDYAEAAGFSRGELRLGLCDQCGFITNMDFEFKAEYSARYEETQGFSAKFVEFGKDLARRWVDKFDLAGKTVLEIGCGKGEFLVWMVEAGAAKGIGIDPGVHPERIDPALDGKLEWIADFYDERFSHLNADAVVCRHTLEHISPVGDFMRLVRRSIGDRLDTVVLFELPDVARVLEEVGFWDVYYEHCSYFSAGSLARLFRSTGFDVLNVELDYDDQYLLIETRPSASPVGGGEPGPLEDDMERLMKGAAHYEMGFEAIVDHWSEKLSAVKAAGGTSVIWGGGSKGVSFTTTLTNLVGAGDLIDCAIDINPHKDGKYLAGTGHQVHLPTHLVELQPALVVAMNPVYVGEIQAELDRLGVAAELDAV